MAITISVGQSGTMTLTVDPAGRVTSGTAIVLSGSGGQAPYRFEALTAMPAGLTLSSDGYIKGTAGAIRGAALVRIRCTDSSSPANFVDVDETITVQ